jgi:hypothetical protein
MARIALGIGLVAVTGTALSLCWMRGQALAAALQPECPKAADQVTGLVGELMVILAETKSKDVFAATVQALGRFGPNARPALPTILEHAERLGALEGAFAQDGSRSQQGKVVLDALAAIAGGQEATPPCWPWCNADGACFRKECPGSATGNTVLTEKELPPLPTFSIGLLPIIPPKEDPPPDGTPDGIHIWMAPGFFR